MAAFGLDPTLAYVIGGALAVVGLALAFWGRGIWKMIMALIGMVLTEEPEPPTKAGTLAPILKGLLIKDPAARLSAWSAGFRKPSRRARRWSPGASAPALISSPRC